MRGANPGLTMAFGGARIAAWGIFTGGKMVLGDASCSSEP